MKYDILKKRRASHEEEIAYAKEMKHEQAWYMQLLP